MSKLEFCDVCGDRVYLPAKDPARHQSCDKMRARIEAETVAAIVAEVERLTAIEVNACEHHARAIKDMHRKARIPLHRMHTCAANQSRALGDTIKRAIERGEWRKGGGHG